MTHARALIVFTALAPLAAGACAARRVSLPTGPGTPVADFQAIFDNATAGCRGVRTLTAELAISGRVGSSRLRGRVLAGLAAPARMRLEGAAPFGQPIFILVAEGRRATLLLPRDNRVIRDEPPEAILAALTGLELAPADLRAILSGCLTPATKPIAARGYGDRVALDLAGGATLFVRRAASGWEPYAGTRESLVVEYHDVANDHPRRVRLRTEGARAAAADVTVEISQLELNVDLDASTFQVKVPADAEPLTVEELRDAGPLGASRRKSALGTRQKAVGRRQ